MPQTPWNSAATNSSMWDTPWAQQAYNSDPYANFNASTDKYRDQYLSGNSPLGSFASGVGSQMQGMGGALGQYGGLWGSMPAPNSPLLAGYLKNLTGGQGNLLDQYAKQQAGAGVAAGRGGTNVAGGSPMDAQLRNSQMKNLAGMFGQNYGQAYDMASRLYGQNLGAWGQGLNAQLGALQSQAQTGLGLGQQELGGLQGSAGWKANMFNQRAGDYRSDINYAQNEPNRWMQYQGWADTRGDQARARQNQANKLDLANRAFLSGDAWKTNLYGYNKFLGG